jgi:DNA polymerase-3 subunit epsilon
MKLNLRNPLCFFDLETTGINITNDRIIEIAVIKLMPNGEVLKKTHLVNPGIPIPPESTAIHGITNEDVNGQTNLQRCSQRLCEVYGGR